MVLQDIHLQLFPLMQRQFDLVGSSFVTGAAESGEGGGGGGKALGAWSVTSIHGELMARVWSALRTFYSIACCLPPIQFAQLVAQVGTARPPAFLAARRTRAKFYECVLSFPAKLCLPLPPLCLASAEPTGCREGPSRRRQRQDRFSGRGFDNKA